MQYSDSLQLSPIFKKSLAKFRILSPKNSYLSISTLQAATVAAVAD